jgi:hypothetical protein
MTSPLHVILLFGLSFGFLQIRLPCYSCINFGLLAAKPNSYVIENMESQVMNTSFLRLKLWTSFLNMLWNINFYMLMLLVRIIFSD